MTPGRCHPDVMNEAGEPIDFKIDEHRFVYGDPLRLCAKHGIRKHCGDDGLPMEDGRHVTGCGPFCCTNSWLCEDHYSVAYLCWKEKNETE